MLLRNRSTDLLKLKNVNFGHHPADQHSDRIRAMPLKLVEYSRLDCDPKLYQVCSKSSSDTHVLLALISPTKLQPIPATPRSKDVLTLAQIRFYALINIQILNFSQKENTYSQALTSAYTTAACLIRASDLCCPSPSSRSQTQRCIHSDLEVFHRLF